jgi:hypothetical protein
MFFPSGKIHDTLELGMNMQPQLRVYTEEVPFLFIVFAAGV